jgi:hypothetical protein
MTLRIDPSNVLAKNFFLGIKSSKEVLKDRRHEERDQSQSQELHGGESREKSCAQGESQQRL